MDIEYLLYLQQFRETVGSILTPLMNAVTKLSAGFLPIAMMCMIYWAFDRKAGRKILAGLGGGLFINGFLSDLPGCLSKNTACPPLRQWYPAW